MKLDLKFSDTLTDWAMYAPTAMEKGVKSGRQNTGELIHPTCVSQKIVCIHKYLVIQGFKKNFKLFCLFDR